MQIMNDNWELETVEGLSSEEAERRLKEEGLNEVAPRKRRTVFRIAFDVFKQPMFLLLVFAGGVYLILGETREALVLLSFVLLIMGITFFQERRAERALDALRNLSSPRALVIRDGRQTRVAGVEVVRDDILVLNEGDRVPADASVIACSNLVVDESLLTGESVPVHKIACEEPGDGSVLGGDVQSHIYAGTLVVKGHALAQVRAVGNQTEMGKIGKFLEEIEPEETVLRRETKRAVVQISLIGMVLFVLVVVVYGITRHHWIEGLLVGITMAMAMVPEELPVVLTVFLTLGAWRLSKSQVLTRDVPAVETLGSATVLCVDKTGTLTLNRMTVKKIMADGETYSFNGSPTRFLPERFHELVEFSVLASQRDPVDPVEKAINQLGNMALDNTEHLHRDWILEREYPLSPELMALSHVWKSPDGHDYIIAAKGAPEAIADLCHLDEHQLDKLSKQVEDMATEGMRVLGVARASFHLGDLPMDQHTFAFEFLGLVGLEDPVRPSVKKSIEECHQAGVRVVMITGDYPGTAQNVAKQISLPSPHQCITGLEIDQMSEEELQERIREVNIFARVVPEQKLRIVKALKANGEIVAMTGDGVNDAPALKAADIGIAMGLRGTDVARESASLVLLDDDFSSIEKAVRMGRRIYDNLRKAVSYVIAVHVPIAGLSLIPVLFKLPLIFSPILIAFLEIVIDPACSLAFEAELEEKNVMRRPPRRPEESIFSKRNLLISLLQGLIVLIVVGGVYAISLIRGMEENEVRTLTFTTLIVANLALILTNRSWEGTIRETLASPNPTLWLIFTGTLVAIGLALFLSSIRNLFRFAPLSFLDISICISAGCFSVFWFEIFKLAARKRKLAGI